MTKIFDRRGADADVVSLTSDSAEFRQIASLLYDKTGILLPSDNASLVVSRLIKHLKRLNLPSFRAYIEWVSRAENAADQADMISLLTTNTTRFFREPYHFDIFAKICIPRARALVAAGERVRFWSAGCSSGEEPYSLAATLVHHWPEVATQDVKILATDICAPAMETARAAQYPREKLEPVPEEMRGLMTEGSGSGPIITIPRPLRDLVSIRYLNFVEPWPTRGPFQAIFCRNVAIYMDDAVQARIWHGLSDLLEPGGLLFIGHSERLPNSLNSELKLIDRTTFQRQ